MSSKASWFRYAEARSTPGIEEFLLFKITSIESWKSKLAMGIFGPFKINNETFPSNFKHSLGGESWSINLESEKVGNFKSLSSVYKV